MNCSGPTPVISIQNSAGVQVAFNQTSGTAAVPYTPTASGTYTIICTTVQPAGDPFLQGGPVTVPFTLSVIQLVAGSTSTSCSANPIIGTPTGTINVTVTGLVPSSGAPAGSVSVSVDGGPSTPAVTITPSGANTSTATITVPTPPGNQVNHQVIATFTGTGIWVGSSGSCTLQVLPVINVSVPVNVAGSLTTQSWSGSKPTNGDIGDFQGHYQQYYAVKLLAGKNYVLSVSTLGSTGTVDSYMSVYNSSGVEQVYNDDAGLQWLGAGVASQVTLTPTVTDTYTVIVSTWNGGATMTYYLMIPNPDPSITPIASLPYSATVSNGNSAADPYAAGLSYYYGFADGTIGYPSGLSPNGNSKPFVDHFQTWFSVNLLANNTYNITLAGPGTPALSVQNSAGVQVAFNKTSGTATLNFVPSANGVYMIICTQNSRGPQPPSNTYTLTVNSPKWAPNGIPNVRLAPGRDRELLLGTFAMGPRVDELGDNRKDTPVLRPTAPPATPCWMARTENLIG